MKRFALRGGSLRLPHFAGLLFLGVLFGVFVGNVLGAPAFAQTTGPVPDLPAILLSGGSYSVDVALPAEVASRGRAERLEYRVRAGETQLVRGSVPTVGEGGEALETVTLDSFVAPAAGEHEIHFELGAVTVTREVRVIPGILSILPPLLAILLAVAFRQVILALLSGVFLGAFVAAGYDPGTALLRTVDQYTVGALADRDHASIIVFSLLLGGMIGVVTKSGGGMGLARLVTGRARTTRGGLFGTWLMGIVIFFDDYANALLVGSTMRPITDRLRVSREKLAFLVDGTAATVSSVALVSSWIGVEVGYIADQFSSLGLEGDPYVIFLETIPHRFYPILMLIFSVLMIYMRRDFGPMLTAERRARETGQVLREGAKPAMEIDASAVAGKGDPSAIDALVPIGAVIAVALGGMYLTGRHAVLEEGGELTLRAIFGNASSLDSLLWAAFIGSGAALVTVVSRRTMTLDAALDAWLAGVKSMVMACIILILAWALGAVCRELDTARWVIGAVGGWITPGLLPALIFVIAALVAFATGTSWGTMAILFPLVVPMAHELAPGDHQIMLGAISSILAGAVWGDHCSPISDTTIMSSMASGCDHIDHVRTQLPYALAVGLVSLVLGDVATGLGLYPAWVGLVLGALALFALLRFVGREVPDYTPTEDLEIAQEG
ncbi:MAG: Na+/H+ antiporter NhaC family protein [Deltaproteobacteria bacterium]|nr:MAG: Na+/H+ antiporter NhaC family protein [Deltaproteobacteria bacterium]